MFEKLIEHVGDTLRQHFTQFSVLFGTGLNDPESLAVQVAALKVSSPAVARSSSIRVRADTEMGEMTIFRAYLAESVSSEGCGAEGCGGRERMKEARS